MELLEELNATNECYVRKKLALDGYSDWQRPVAQHWLTERNLARKEAVTKSRMRWLRLRVFVALCGFVGTLLWHYPIVFNAPFIR
ncbi:hypothetical protein [Xylophilus rhododendri]|nr:hypothetical protein [Xylophilus rhododendri]